MTSVLPVPEPADPVEGQPGHFEHSNWVKASLKALDQKIEQEVVLTNIPGLKIYRFSGILGDIVAGSTVIEGTLSLAPAGFTGNPFVVVTPATPFNVVTWAVSTRGISPTSVTVRATGAASPGQSPFSVSGIAIGL